MTGEAAARRDQLREELNRLKLNACAVGFGPNVRYLSGFTGSNGLLLVSSDGDLLLTDPRYEIQAAQETDCLTGVIRGPLWPALAEEVKRRRLRKVGFEATRISYEAHCLLGDRMGARVSLEGVPERWNASG